MNHHCMNASVPQHLYGYVNRLILRGMEPDELPKPLTFWQRVIAWITGKRPLKPQKFEPCVIFGVTSIPSRALHFSVLCESGAQWARIPLHMLRWEMPSIVRVPEHPLTDLQMWDSHGWDFSVVRYEYLREMGCHYRKRDGSLVPASYWFTLDHTDNGYSQYPPEHKCYHLLLLEDGSGQIAAQPNNRILWRDDSFCKPGHALDYKVMVPQTWHAELGRNAQETAFTKD